LPAEGGSEIKSLNAFYAYERLQLKESPNGAFIYDSFALPFRRSFNYFTDATIARAKRFLTHNLAASLALHRPQQPPPAVLSLYGRKRHKEGN